jgi:tetratricopeptide (TPR) repeat protein
MMRLAVALGVLLSGLLSQSAPAAPAPADDARACALGSSPAAIESCTRALASRRFTRAETALLHYRRAMLRRDAADLAAAIDDFTTAIHLNGDVIPMSADAFDLRTSLRNAYLNRGRAYAAAGDAVRARADYEALLRADPKDVQALAARAASFEATGACDRALVDYDAVLALDPRAWESQIGRAHCYATLGQRDRAIAAYRATLALALPDAVKPNVAAALRALGAEP